jgi:hypothetical protein
MPPLPPRQPLAGAGSPQAPLEEPLGEPLELGIGFRGHGDGGAYLTDLLSHGAGGGGLGQFSQGHVGQPWEGAPTFRDGSAGFLGGEAGGGVGCGGGWIAAGQGFGATPFQGSAFEEAPAGAADMGDA